MNKNGRYIITKRGQPMTGPECLAALGLPLDSAGAGSIPHWIAAHLDNFTKKAKDLGIALAYVPDSNHAPVTHTQKATAQTSPGTRSWDSIPFKERVLMAKNAGLPGITGAKDFKELTKEEIEAMQDKPETHSAPVPPEETPAMTSQSIAEYIDSLTNEIASLKAKLRKAERTIASLTA